MILYVIGLMVLHLALSCTVGIMAARLFRAAPDRAVLSLTILFVISNAILIAGWIIMIPGIIALIQSWFIGPGL